MPKKVIVGLGNPGAEYENTYHNAGFLALDMMLPSSWKKHKNLFEYAESGEMVFVKPLTYMNESGKAVREALKKFKAKPGDLVVIHDESDLVIGNFKISIGRSSAGHRGVQSIIDTLGTNAFTRVRIGIRAARETKRKKAGEFALKKISAKDKKTLDTVFAKIYSSYTKTSP